MTLVLFVLLNAVVFGAAKAPPFEVLSILPLRLDAGRQRLGSNTPLTVVYSLPVIRLGTL